MKQAQIRTVFAPRMDGRRLVIKVKTIVKQKNVNAVVLLIRCAWDASSRKHVSITLPTTSGTRLIPSVTWATSTATITFPSVASAVVATPTRKSATIHS